ncbi:glutathione S-transferase C-terminal domain-containing protein [Embleya sp. NBC_00896]|uniref:glutathione S-transferase C-terminal domain-containing protein n=1 Tax=Embleya sp. NBC_00896 TaxID=2975961 RepID=UPI0038697ECB|nr:glutathione S-transferase C-terminal domain-containing protein [Embleya sp. NBC_00896]
MTTQLGYASPVDLDTYGAYAVSDPQYPFIGRLGDPDFPEEAGRYHLYLSHGCPWAHIAAIVRHARGLTEVISASYVDEERDGRGWAFRERFGPDPVNGFTLLRDAYEATRPGYTGHISVPTLWDRAGHRIVANAYNDIPNNLATAFEGFADPAAADLYAEDLREAIDTTDTDFATAARRGGLWTSEEGETINTLERSDAHLADKRYLFGNRFTLSDIRFWVKLLRFPETYRAAIAQDGRTLVDYPNLWGYARDLYTRPEFRATTDLAVQAENRARRFPDSPAGPTAEQWAAPHDRATLG